MGGSDVNGYQPGNLDSKGMGDAPNREFTMPVSRKIATRDGDNENPLDYDTDEPEKISSPRSYAVTCCSWDRYPGQSGHMLNSRRLVVVFLVISTILFMW